MFPTGGGSAQTVAPESAAPQSQQGLDFFRAFAQIAAQNSHAQQPNNQYLASLGQQSVHAAQLAAQQNSPSLSLLQQGVARQPVRDDPHRRPSLMSNFFPPIMGHQQGSSRGESFRYDNHLDVDTSGSFAGMKIDPSPGGTTLSEKETEENIKKESEQEVKEVPVVEPDERENIPLWQRIIAENKKRAAAKTRLTQKRAAPETLFFEPCDAPGMSELLKKQKTFGPKLRQMVEYRHRVKEACYKCNDEFYNSCMRDFLRKTERWEHSPKKMSANLVDSRARDLRNREIFERAFPEMKRAREEKERSSRNDRVSLRAQESDDQTANSEKVGFFNVEMETAPNFKPFCYFCTM
ncbi:hypothetical protein OESDEN_06026 [Oesophagostomum dentatum]|uniref:Uncharacterized protein n=1 Tax=Oesophagostomum dentatum TaxID=61180 RepID=A0A0B1T914_OESDE|nr:hypothetical protein OESDEN_06026 [Oesophagostomum dentatum]